MQLPQYLMKNKICNGPLCRRKKKPVTEFHKNKCREDGLSDWCKECKNEYQRQYHQNNPEYQKQYEQSVNGRRVTYKAGAKERNLEFMLTLEQFEILTSQPCHYCGQYTKNKNFCGIDRVNNDAGYVLTNCVPCCTSCNEMKGKRTSKEFFNCIKRVYEHFIK